MSTGKILIVEDESIVALDIEIRIKNIGYTVCGVASNGKKAIHNAKNNSPNLVLTNINLKLNINGIEADKSIHTNLAISTIYLTANTDDFCLEKQNLQNH